MMKEGIEMYNEETAVFKNKCTIGKIIIFILSILYVIAMMVTLGVSMYGACDMFTHDSWLGGCACLGFAGIVLYNIIKFLLDCEKKIR